MNTLAFKANPQLTMGVELELQLVDLHDFNLTNKVQDLFRVLPKIKKAEIKPEITQSMIEINTSVHLSYSELLNELCQLQNILLEATAQIAVGICGGGAHPFQKWIKQKIYHTELFDSLSAQYGYLLKQLTVFGQHIHIASANGDEAIYLCHAFARYLPHFIVLAATSPFHQGADTSFDSSRLTALSAFPFSGTLPWLDTWESFNDYYNKMVRLGIIQRVTEFFWDIRPQPVFGTVEIRICDTPLTVNKAAQLAAYAQMLARYLLTNRQKISREIYFSYTINRFRAARYGFDAILIDPILEQQMPICVDILATCQQLEEHAKILDSLEALQLIRDSVLNRDNGAQWLRTQYSQVQSLSEVVKMQLELWRC